MSACRVISLICLIIASVVAQEEHSFSDSTVFRLFVEAGDFLNAEQRCLSETNSTFDSNLARIDSNEQFNFIVNEFNLGSRQLEVIEGRMAIWIGLRRFPETAEETRSTEGFFFVDVDDINEGRQFFEDSGEFPWALSQPNNVAGAQHCVSWELQQLNDDDLALTWYDDNCDLTFSAFMCRGEVLPTPEPTRSPSASPNKSPSSTPTKAPSSSPSPKPTGSPSTLAPTEAPTKEKVDYSEIILLSAAGIAGMLMVCFLIFLLCEMKGISFMSRTLDDIEWAKNMKKIVLVEDSENGSASASESS